MNYGQNTNGLNYSQQRFYLRSFDRLINPDKTDTERVVRFDFNTVVTQTPPESEFERQKRAYENLPPEVLAQYHGQFVAAHNGVILESDNNFQALTQRFVRNHGYIPVYITKVGGKLRVTIPARLPR